MTRHRVLIGAALATLGLGLFLALRLQDRDARHIRRAFRGLCNTVELDRRESPLVAAATAKAVGNYFTGDVELALDLLPQGLSSRGDLVAVVAQARMRLDRFHVSVLGQELRMDPGRTDATMTLTARSRVEGGGESESAVREVELRWRKTEAGWRIASARTLQTVRRP